MAPNFIGAQFSQIPRVFVQIIFADHSLVTFVIIRQIIRTTDTSI